MTLFSKSNITLISYSLLAFLAFSLFYIGIFNDYGFTDAYEFLWSAHENLIFKHVFIQSGRPLYGELNQLYYGTLCNTISDLKWIRLVSLISCVFLSTQIFRFLIQLNFKRLEAALFSFLMLALPSIGIYASWSVVHEIPWALNCSFFAGALLLRSSHNIKHRTLKYLFALIINIVALNLYQPAATAFLIPLVIYLILDQKRVSSLLIRFGLFYILSFSVYYIFFKFSLLFYNIPALSRSEIDFINLPYRFLNFYLKELTSTFYGSAILLRSYLILTAGISLVFGFFILLLIKKKLDKKIVLLLLFLLLVLPVSYLPNLLSSDTWRSTRTIAPAAIIVLFYQFYFLRTLSNKNSIIKYLSLILAIAFIAGNSLNVNIYFTGIQTKEYAALKKAFKIISNENKVVLIRPKINFLQQSNFYKWKYADEYGQLSSERDWVPVALFHQIISEKSIHLNSRSHTPYHVITVGTNDFYEKSNDITAINLENILQEAFYDQKN